MNEHKELYQQDRFIEKMIDNGYQLFDPKNYQDILNNFKKKLEELNQFKLSNNEFETFYNLINQGTVFERTKKLLREHDITLDNGELKVLRLINKEKWCENNFQIAKEVKLEKIGMDGKTCRLDSVIFINGLPLTIIEFKQSEVGNRQALTQIVDYQKDGKFHDLFLYNQIFVVSSFATSRYFVNNNKIDPKFVFPWTDYENKEISQMITGNNTFYDTFLSRCFLAEMIVRYIVQKDSKKLNIILRPYQVYATKRILEKVKYNDGDGYIFHTTGSGKTITSFKTCQLLSSFKQIDKIIYLVDRKDLDTQTKDEYEELEKNSYDHAQSSFHLKKHLLSTSVKPIIATVQKMVHTINNLSDQQKEDLLNKRIVIINDECHRSQGDATVSALREIFNPNKNTQYFGFTGTPIFEENQKEGDIHYKTTEKVFGQELHRYSITNAVKDGNVLQFNIDYLNNLHNPDSTTNHPDRIKKISEFIINKLNDYTNDLRFNAIFATQSKSDLKLYYKALKEYNSTLKEEDKIKFTSIFSTNPQDTEEYADSSQEDQFVTDVINDFNHNFNTSESTSDINSFKGRVYDYVREKKLDLVIVVNMLLTGFDSPMTKALFVDKNLKYHTLLQAYSRVNRIAEHKEYGNIITFVDQKEDRDKALKLFSAGGTHTDFEIKNYDELIDDFNQQLNKVNTVVPNVDALIDHLEGGNLDQIYNSLELIKELQKQYSFLKYHPNFIEDDLGINKKDLNDLKDAYRETKRKLNGQSKSKEQDNEENEQKEFDFELNLFEETNINLEYLLKLIPNKINVDEKDKIIERIEASDYPQEIRISAIQFVNDKNKEDYQSVVQYLKQDFEKKKNNDLIKMIEPLSIMHTDAFIEMTKKQEDGSMSESNKNDYQKVIDKKLNYGEQTKVIGEIYFQVAETIEKYDFEKYDK